MDGKQVIRWIREIFGERMDDAVYIVREDRQELSVGPDPLHLQVGPPKALAHGVQGEAEIPIRHADLALAFALSEPDLPQRTCAVADLLDAGAAALEKMIAESEPQLAADELLGLQCVGLLYGRPLIRIGTRGDLGDIPSFWNVMEEQRPEIESAARSVGRIELLGHPEYDWAGTGFLISPGCLLTTRGTCEQFAEQRDGAWQFRPGISAWIDFQPERIGPGSARCRVLSVIGAHEHYDLALVGVERQQNEGSPAPLCLAAHAPLSVDAARVAMISYPARDARRNEPESIARIFHDAYNSKRVQPGRIDRHFLFNDVYLLVHDCATLGLSAGAPIIDLPSGLVLGLQVSGRYLETGTAIPLWKLSCDPLLKKAGPTFVDIASPSEEEKATRLVRRLAHTWLWPQVQTALDSFAHRAFEEPT